MKAPTIAIAFSVLAFSWTCADSNWPQFRGADARGVSENPGLPDRWSSTENVEWKTEIEGRGWSSPVVWGNRVFFTTALNLEELEPPKKGLYFGGNRPKPQSGFVWQTICLNLETGKEVWTKEAHRGTPDTAIHLKNSFATETPVVDGERLYVVFGNIGIYCYDLEGELIWDKKLTPHKTRYGWGTAASPVLHEGRLYHVDDNQEDSSIFCLDAKTGKEIWRTPRDEKSNWSTPYIWKNAVRTEIVTPGSGTNRSYDLDGKLLWTLKGMSSITIATPYEHQGLLVLSSGYIGDFKARPIYAIKPGAKGDISLGKSETSNEFVAWCQKMAAPYNPSTIAYGDILYVLHDRGFMTAFRMKDGSPVYGKQRVSSSGFTTSPWAYDGNIFCLDENGVTHVIKAGEDFEVLHRNKLAPDDMGMACPAMAGDRLLIRTKARIYCVRNPEGKRP